MRDTGWARQGGDMTRHRATRGTRYRASRLDLFGEGLLRVYRLPVRWDDVTGWEDDRVP